MPLVPIENTVQHRISDHRATTTLPRYASSQAPIISTHPSAPQTTLSVSSLSSSRIHNSSTLANQASPSDATSANHSPSYHGPGVPGSNRTSATSPSERDDEEMRGDLEAGESNTEVDQRGGWRDEEDEDGESDVYVPSEAGDGARGGAGTGMDEEDPDVDTEENERIIIRGDEEKDPKNQNRTSKKSKKAQPKASDYDEDIEALLNHASGLMRSLVVSENPMPSVDESIQLAGDAYHLAKLDRPHINPPTQVKHISIVRMCFYLLIGQF